MNRKILRWEVPVDDEWHSLLISGEVLHVAARKPQSVEFWTIEVDTRKSRPRAFRVFGTGQPLPPEAGTYVGTAVIGPLVWHLFEYV